jgi:hypothetical protein
VAEIKGFINLIAKLRVKAAKVADADVQVGYTASYALYVDQNRAARHTNGRAGFLTDVARERAKELGQLVHRLLKQGKTMVESLLIAGLQLQRWSQKECTVLTGNLKGSAFTRLVQR